MNQPVRSRFNLLHEVFEKALSESLKPLTVEELEPALQGFPKGTAEELSQITLESTIDNVRKSFEQILEDRNVKDRLDKLDYLYEKQRNSYELDMSAFEFDEYDPEHVKRSIIYEAKKREVQRLTKYLKDLEQKNQDLIDQNKTIVEKYEKSRGKIQQAQDEIQSLLSSEQ